MKKIGIACMMAILAATGMVSCQESAEKNEQSLAYKIENKEALSADDYSTIIDYVGQYAEKAQKYVDMEINDENSQEAMDGMNQLNEEYPYLSLYRNCLRFTPCSALSKDNLDQVAKYAGYIEFTAPAGYTIQTMPAEDAGLEVAAPSEDNGVVAGAVDNTKIEERNDW